MIRWAALVLGIAVCFGCGGKVVFEVDGDGSGGSAAGGAGGPGGMGVGGSADGGAGGSGGLDAFKPCENKLCGDGCTVCNDVECLMGRCTVDQQCVPDDVPCPAG